MNDDETEAAAIATLIGAVDGNVVGWVYRWNTGALAVRWVRGPERVSGSVPDLSDAQKREIDFDALTGMQADRDGQD